MYKIKKLHCSECSATSYEYFARYIGDPKKLGVSSFVVLLMLRRENEIFFEVFYLVQILHDTIDDTNKSICKEFNSLKK